MKRVNSVTLNNRITIRIKNNHKRYKSFFFSFQRLILLYLIMLTQTYIEKMLRHAIFQLDEQTRGRAVVVTACHEWDKRMNGPDRESRDESTTAMIALMGRRAGIWDAGRNGNVTLGTDGHFTSGLPRENRQEGEGRVTLNRMHRIRRTLWN